MATAGLEPAVPGSEGRCPVSRATRRNQVTIATIGTGGPTRPKATLCWRSDIVGRENYPERQALNKSQGLFCLGAKQA